MSVRMSGTRFFSGSSQRCSPSADGFQVGHSARLGPVRINSVGLTAVLGRFILMAGMPRPRLRQKAGQSLTIALIPRCRVHRSPPWRRHNSSTFRHSRMQA